MENRFTTLTRRWYFFLGASVVLTAAGMFALALMYDVLFLVCFFLCFAVLILMCVLFVTALLQRAWGRSVALFISALLTAVMLFFSLTVYLLTDAMNRTHPNTEGEVVDTVDVQPADTLEVIVADTLVDE